MGSRKSQHALWFVLLVVVALMYRVAHTPDFGEVETSELSEDVENILEQESDPSQILNPEVDEILDFVRSRSTEVNGNPTVIVSYITNNYVLMALNYIRFLLELDITNYALICLDAKSADTLSYWGIPNYMVDLGLNTVETEESTESNLNEVNRRQLLNKKGGKRSERERKIRKIWAIRMQHLDKFVSNGLDVVFSDVDAIWLQNPFKTGLFSPDTADIVGGLGKFPYDVATKWGGTFCMGVAYFHATYPSQVIIKDAARKVIKLRDDQVAMNEVLFGWGGDGPISLFGFRLSIEKPRTAVASFNDKNMQKKGLKKKKSQSKSPYAMDKSDVADIPAEEATIDSHVSFAIVSHNKIPRFCNNVPKGKWDGGVEIAHCHHGDGKTMATHSAWGASQLRVEKMKSLGLWCLPDDWVGGPDMKALVPEANDVADFEAWMKQRVVTCRRNIASESNPNLSS